MKKIFVSISFVILFSNQIFAQVYKDSFPYTGIKLGFNYSKFIGNDKPGKNVSAIPGFAIGGFLCYKFSCTVSAHQELYITTKGSRINTVGDVNINNVFVYVQALPFLVKVTLFSENSYQFKPVILFGPSFGMKVIAMNFTGMLEDIKTIDWGVIFRIGIEYRKISFEISYDCSLSNFDLSATDIDLRNQTISLITGLAF